MSHAVKSVNWGDTTIKEGDMCFMKGGAQPLRVIDVDYGGRDWDGHCVVVEDTSGLKTPVDLAFFVTHFDIGSDI